MKKINEITLREVKQDSKNVFNTEIKATSQGMKVKYLGVDKDNTIYFQCTSGSNKNKKYIQKIKLLDIDKNIKKYKNNKKYKFKDIIIKSIKGDVKIYCSDPSFLYYGWEYINTQLDSGLEKEEREPIIRNPNLEGCVCKHLYLVILKLHKYINKITEDFKYIKKYK